MARSETMGRETVTVDDKVTRPPVSEARIAPLPPVTPLNQVHYPRDPSSTTPATISSPAVRTLVPSTVDFATFVSPRATD